MKHSGFKVHRYLSYLFPSVIFNNLHISDRHGYRMLVIILNGLVLFIFWWISLFYLTAVYCVLFMPFGSYFVRLRPHCRQIWLVLARLQIGTWSSEQTRVPAKNWSTTEMAIKPNCFFGHVSRYAVCQRQEEPFVTHSEYLYLSQKGI